MLGDVLQAHFPSSELAVMRDGERVMEEVEMFLPELMLIEVKLGGGDGFELTRKIKKVYPDVPIILVGSYDLPEYRKAADMSGADYFMPKESAVEDYFTLIRSILLTRRRAG
jgi:DNA-binding NarL/FixJ family response regulator